MMRIGSYRPHFGSKAIGYECETGPGGIVRENDTFTCQHCNVIVTIQPMCRPEDLQFGGQCKGCMGLICLKCYNKGGCDPIEKKIERHEARARLWREL
jgi:hypothetical protein